jgi:hypothetical protein
VILAYISLEVISYIKDVVDDITINSLNLYLIIIQCPTCSISKATEIISRRTEVEDEATGPFNRISYDLI